MTSSKQQKARELREASLPRLGWKKVDGYWINPRSGRRYDVKGAINIEDLRGTFARERMAAYNATRPARDRKGERARRGRPPGIHTIPQRTAQFA